MIVGGVAARLPGAQYQRRSRLAAANRRQLTRLATALKELHAYPRVEGLTDEEARQLPVVIDAAAFASMDISTWRTDAGDVGILIGLPTRSGGRASYDQLVERADHHIIGATRVDVAALEDVTASKEWSNRPKDHEALDELRPSTTTSKRQTRLARAVVASAAPTSTRKESDRGLPAP